MTTPNELVNQVCLDYHTGKKLPGYNTESNECLYYKKSDTVPIRCGIGSLFTNKTAATLRSSTKSFYALYESGRDIIRKEIEDSIEYADFKNPDGTLNFRGNKFFMDLQHSHDHYFNHGRGSECENPVSISDFIWNRMKGCYPELITQYFLLTTETNDLSNLP